LNYVPKMAEEKRSRRKGPSAAWFWPRGKKRTARQVSLRAAPRYSPNLASRRNLPRDGTQEGITRSRPETTLPMPLISQRYDAQRRAT